MGRHSRKGRGEGGNPPEKPAPATAPSPARGPSAQGPSGRRQAPPTAPPGTSPPGRPSGPAPGAATRTGAGNAPGMTPRTAPGMPGPGGPPRPGGPQFGGSAATTPAHGSPFVGGPAPGARGGHPQHREPGGGWGENAAGHGPAPGRVVRGGPPVGPPGTTGAPLGHPPGHAPGPRREYLEAFEDDVFAAGAPERRMPGQRAGRPPHTGQFPRQESPDEEQATRGPWPDDDEDDEPPAPLAPIRPPEEKGGKGRAFTGVAAAAVTTVLAVVVAGQVTGGEHDRNTRAASAEAGRGGPGSEASRSDARPAPSKPAKPQLSYTEKISTVLPLDVDLAGPNSFTAVGGHQKGAEGDEVLRYRVDVEKELPLDGELFAEALHRTLNDERSWAHDGERSFERVASGKADFVITLASPATTGVWCAKSGLDTTEQHVSCDSAATQRIMINAYRWAQGSKTFGDKRIRQYREMLINHEVGHRLGRNHRVCPEEGALAPVMMQQTKTLTLGGATCRPNAWPFPSA